MLKTILATLATLCIVSSYIPQIIKGYKTKSLKDISLMFLVIIVIGTILWTMYGFVTKDKILLSANLVILVFSIWLTTMKIVYEKR